MKLYAEIQRTAPAFETTTDAPTLETAIAEAKEYDFRFISPGFFLCIHKENAYAISEHNKQVGCACPDMTFRCKPPRDACKHIRNFVALPEYPMNPIDADMAAQLKAAGWIGSKLHPPDLPKKAKKKLPNIKSERSPQPQAAVRADRHKDYAGKSTIEIVKAMSNEEVRRNAGKGGVACVAELERRKAAGVI